MIRNLTCIGCPMGCSLTVEVENGVAVSVKGNTCGIGKRYAEQEVSAPTRMVTTTVLSPKGKPIPVKTMNPIPKEKIFEVVDEIKSAKVALPVSIGDVLIENVADTGIPVIITGEAGR